MFVFAPRWLNTFVTMAYEMNTNLTCHMTNFENIFIAIWFHPSFCILNSIFISFVFAERRTRRKYLFYFPFVSEKHLSSSNIFLLITLQLFWCDYIPIPIQSRIHSGKYKNVWIFIFFVENNSFVFISNYCFPTVFGSGRCSTQLT